MVATVVVSIGQYINLLNHYVVHLKLINIVGQPY